MLAFSGNFPRQIKRLIRGTPILLVGGNPGGHGGAAIVVFRRVLSKLYVDVVGDTPSSSLRIAAMASTSAYLRSGSRPGRRSTVFNDTPSPITPKTSDTAT